MSRTAWCLWMLEEMGQPYELVETSLRPEEIVRDTSRAERAELLLQKPLGILNEALATQKFLLGNGFTVADLNVAGLLFWGKMTHLDFSSVDTLGKHCLISLYSATPS